VASGATVVRYKPLETACASCHADQHQGQFRVATPGHAARGCEFCHTTKAFKPSLFAHDDPEFTTYGLEGKHAKVACGKCHPTVGLEGGVRTVRYRSVPRACEGCHVDYHHGEFRGFEP
jgi:hypothetical protein